MITSKAEIDFLKFDEYYALARSLTGNAIFQLIIEMLVVKRKYFENIDTTEAVDEIAIVLMSCDPFKLSSKQYLKDFSHYLLLSIPTLRFFITLNTTSQMPRD